MTLSVTVQSVILLTLWLSSMILIVCRIGQLTGDMIPAVGQSVHCQNLDQMEDAPIYLQQL